jgi:hypothetical protein
MRGASRRSVKMGEMIRSDQSVRFPSISSPLCIYYKVGVQDKLQMALFTLRVCCSPMQQSPPFIFVEDYPHLLRMNEITYNRLVTLHFTSSH